MLTNYERSRTNPLSRPSPICFFFLCFSFWLPPRFCASHFGCLLCATLPFSFGALSLFPAGDHFPYLREEIPQGRKFTMGRVESSAEATPAALVACGALPFPTLSHCTYPRGPPHITWLILPIGSHGDTPRDMQLIVAHELCPFSLHSRVRTAKCCATPQFHPPSISHS